MSVITVPRREHTGGAFQAQLAAPLAAAGMVLTADNLTGWPNGATGQFVATVARGRSNEERILCETRSGNSLAILERGWDGTGAVDHDTGEPVEHTDSATEFDEANAHIVSIEAHGVSGGFVDFDTPQTLKNKSMSGTENTFTQLPATAVVGLPTLIPVGTLLMNAQTSATAPEGWLWCQGQAVSRSTYLALYMAIGTNYGGGDGVSTFNVPDLQSRFPVGANGNDPNFNALGKRGGANSVVLDGNQLPQHAHTLSDTDVNHFHQGTTAQQTANHQHQIPNHRHQILSHITGIGNPQTLVMAGPDPGTVGHGSPPTALDGGGGFVGGDSNAHGHAFDTGWMHENNLHGHAVGLSGASTPVATMPAYIAINFMIRAS